VEIHLEMTTPIILEIVVQQGESMSALKSTREAQHCGSESPSILGSIILAGNQVDAGFQSFVSEG
jgi:hypothetical protein